MVFIYVHFFFVNFVILNALRGLSAVNKLKKIDLMSEKSMCLRSANVTEVSWDCCKGPWRGLLLTFGSKDRRRETDMPLQEGKYKFSGFRSR